MSFVRTWLGVCLGLVAAFVADTARAAAPKTERLIAANFDWDDNVMNMPTRIWLRSKSGGSERGVSTAEWARIKDTVGKPGAYSEYEVDFDRRRGSFREFGRRHARNTFLRDVQGAIAQPGWKGPDWDAFVAALSRPETAKNTSIITARGHSPRALYTALEHLKSRGLIQHLPPRQNLFAVMYEGLRVANRPLSGGTSERKAQVMQNLLDRLQRRASRAAAAKASWRFSDDDYDNVHTAVSVLGKSGRRWPSVKISVHYTGPSVRGRARTVRP